MDPLTLAAITSGVGLVKQALGTAKDIKDVAGQIDALLGHAEKPSTPPKKLTRQQQILRARTGGGDGSDETDIAEAADAIILRKKAQYELDLLKDEVNRVWPVKHGEQTTWDAILEEREKRISAKKKAAKKRAAKAADQRAFIKKAATIFAQLLAVTGVAIGIGYIIWTNRCTSSVC